MKCGEKKINKGVLIKDLTDFKKKKFEGGRNMISKGRLPQALLEMMDAETEIIKYLT